MLFTKFKRKHLTGNNIESNSFTIAKHPKMDCYKLKERLETITCHIHGDAAQVTVLENNTVKIESCCVLFRYQLLLMARENEKMVVA